MTAFFNNDFTEFMNAIENYSGYDKIMYLSIFVDDDNELKNMYIAAANKHNKKIIEDAMFADAGFDLYLPSNKRINDSSSLDDDKSSSSDDTGTKFFGVGWEDKGPVNKVDFKIKCSAGIFYVGKYIRNNLQILNHSTGFYIYPRSSLSKTPLRLANATGIIDAGYRGNIIGMFDVVNILPNDDSDCDYYADAYDRLLQICAPSLVPIYVNIVNTVDELGPNTSRGGGGFGSTGK